MSQRVLIKGKVKIQNLELAEECIKELNANRLRVENDNFVFNDYDYYDGRGKDKLIEELEVRYKEKFREYQKEKILENAKKNGYKVKKEIQENNKVKLVLVKRSY